MSKHVKRGFGQVVFATSKQGQMSSIYCGLLMILVGKSSFIDKQSAECSFIGQAKKCWMQSRTVDMLYGG